MEELVSWLTLLYIASLCPFTSKYSLQHFVPSSLHITEMKTKLLVHDVNLTADILNPWTNLFLLWHVDVSIRSPQDCSKGWKHPKMPSHSGPLKWLSLVREQFSVQLLPHHLAHPELATRLMTPEDCCSIRKAAQKEIKNKYCCDK